MDVQDLDGESDAKAGGSGEMPKPHTIQLELIDEPKQLLVALKPISDDGGNLLSIFYERKSLTPRGHIPTEVDLERPPDRLMHIVETLRDVGVNVIHVGAKYPGEEVMVVLVGDIVDSNPSNTLHRIESSADATFQGLPLSVHEGTDEASSARFRLMVRPGHVGETFRVVHGAAAGKELHVVEPLAGGPQ